MRITNQISNNTLVNTLARHQSQLDETQNQLGTGLKISRPSDDPSATTNNMYFRSRVNELDQFMKNATEGKARLQQVDGQLERVTEILQRVRVLTVQASNGIYQGDKGFELEVAIGKEINELLKATIDIANTRDVTGRYLFGGHTIDRPPFEAMEAKMKGLKGIEIQDQIVGVEYRGDIGDQVREIERNEYMGVNVAGNRAFWGTNMSITANRDSSEYAATSDQKFKIDGVEISISAGDRLDDIIDKINSSPLDVKASKLGSDNITLSSTSPHQIWLEDSDAGTVLRDLGLVEVNYSEPPTNYSKEATVAGNSIFDVMIQLRNDLTAKDQERISGRDLGDIDMALENILRHRSIVGAKMNRLEEHEKRIDFDKSFMAELLAKNEAIDFPETIMNLKWLETIHQSALSVGSKVIKPTLMDFLR
ncbi:MAG TPA: flagellar hook-associated protein 3 [Leptospiraceae bacterium]|nr:flagellar hook-associated protein 3 [Leptospiraceae bacterium]HRG75396.1 flagellar hook-associated protein 3 [Leptospiraceae bacterium]